MELFNPSYINYLLYSLLSIALIYLTGHLIIGTVYTNTNKNVLLFLKLFVGYVVTISLFAIIWTSGNTIFLFSLLLLLIMLYEKIWYQKKNISVNIKNLGKAEIKQLLVLILFIVGFYSLTYYVFFNNGIGNIWCDYPVYANITRNITQTHIEGAFVLPELMTTEKYHFGDIWTNVIFSLFFRANYLYIYLLVVIPFFATIIFQGGLAIIEAIGIKNWFIYFTLGLLILFIKPMTIYVNSNIYFSFIDYPKLGVVYLFFIASIILFIEKRYLLGCLAMLALISFYTPAAPGVIGGLTATVLFLYYKREIKIRNRNRYVIYIILSIVFYVIFYYLVNEGTFSNSPQTDHSFAWVLWFVLKKSLAYILSFVLGILVLFGIYLVFRIRSDRLIDSKTQVLFIGVMAGLFSSIFIGGLYSIISIEGSQIIKVYAPVLSILYFFIVVKLSCQISIIKAKTLSLIILMVFILNSLYNNSAFYFGGGNDDWEKINPEHYEYLNELINHDNREFAYLRNYSNQRLSTNHLYRLYMFPPMHKIIHFSGVYRPFCLSVYDIPDAIPPEYDDRHLSLFYQYVQGQKERNNFISLSQSQIQFIKDYNIGYLIVERNALLSLELINLTDKKIVDSLGNTFYVLAE